MKLVGGLFCLILMSVCSLKNQGSSSERHPFNDNVDNAQTSVLTQPTHSPHVPGTISGQLLNDKAILMPAPETAKGKTVNATVTVQVLVDKTGNVVSAVAVSGPKTLRESAVNAARKAKFEPRLISGEPVQVSGVLAYYF